MRLGCCVCRYSALNRFGIFREDLDVFLTFEGDNTVLMQQVAQGLLSQYKKKFAAHPFTGMLMMMRDMGSAVLRQRNPVATRYRSEAHLLSEEFQLGVMDYRVQRQLMAVARRMRTLSKTMDPFAAWNECLNDVMQLAFAYVHQQILICMYDRVNKCQDSGVKAVLRTCANMVRVCVRARLCMLA